MFDGDTETGADRDGEEEVEEQSRGGKKVVGAEEGDGETNGGLGCGAIRLERLAGGAEEEREEERASELETTFVCVSVVLVCLFIM